MHCATDPTVVSRQVVATVHVRRIMLCSNVCTQVVASVRRIPKMDKFIRDVFHAVCEVDNNERGPSRLVWSGLVW